MAPRTPRYRTGSEPLDEQIAALVAAAGVGRDGDLVFEMIVSAVRMGRESVDRGDLKLVNAALKELRYSFLVFEPYLSFPKVSIFGSARTQRDDPAFLMARDFGEKMVQHDWMVITGAGPGIMEAGLEGAGAEHAFGVNIVLPFESSAAPVILGDPKLINYRYFFTRKLTFMKESKGFALLPGGFGTMDEAFELLTLMQTGRSPVVPVVLLEPEGGTFWSNWLEFVEMDLAERQLISPQDLALCRICTTVEDAVEEVTSFYSTYHSQRYVGRRLVIRLNQDIDDDLLASINDEFRDIVVTGEIKRAETSPSEIDDDDFVDLPRLAFQFDKASYACLRHLINRLNGRP